MLAAYADSVARGIERALRRGRRLLGRRRRRRRDVGGLLRSDAQRASRRHRRVAASAGARSANDRGAWIWNIVSKCDSSACRSSPIGRCSIWSGCRRRSFPKRSSPQGCAACMSALRSGGWLIVGAGRFDDDDALAVAVTRWRTLRSGGTPLTAEEAHTSLAAAGFVEITDLPTPPGAPTLYAARKAPTS